MDKPHLIFWLTMIVIGLAIYIWVVDIESSLEPFDSSMEALDSSPSTSEAKGYYKTLLVFAHSDAAGSSIASHRILGDLRDRLFKKRTFRSSLISSQILENYPKWLPPLETTQKEPVPSVQDAVQAELRILSYIQKNYPQEPDIVPQTGSIVTNIMNDFATRFVFEPNEPIELKPDFMVIPITRGWTNPTAKL
jgi:hypothetical protein